LLKTRDLRDFLRKLVSRTLSPLQERGSAFFRRPRGRKAAQEKCDFVAIDFREVVEALRLTVRANRKL